MKREKTVGMVFDDKLFLLEYLLLQLECMSTNWIKKQMSSEKVSQPLEITGNISSLLKYPGTKQDLE